jgi:flagellar hook-length control protein FliK
MIFVEQKTSTTDSKSAFNLSAPSKDEKPTLSFSELLRGASTKSDKKIVQNGALVLAFDKSEKTALTDDKKDFSALLKNTSDVDLKTDNKKSDSKTSKTTADKIEINPQATSNMTPKEIKLLISDAKRFLKEKIVQSDGYKKSEIKELPKTLKGLAEVAKKFGIDISKISLEEVKVADKSKTISKSIDADSDVQDVKAKIKTEIKTDAQEKTAPKQEIKTEIKTKVEVKTDAQEKAEVKQEIKQEVKTEIKTKVEVKTDAQEKVDVKTDLKSEAKQNIKTDAQDLKQTNKAEVKADAQESKAQENTQNQTISKKEEVKFTPLFKAQNEHKVTTEQTLQAREFKLTEPTNPHRKTPKQRADETLSLLLRGEKAVKTDASSNFTADFSVATAKVIAPSATTDAQKSLESLLRGDAVEGGASKTDGLNVPKADSFEVKLNEAKQMNKYLSQDIRQAIENYKPPFTRIKVQLNPQKLGEVDLTVVQRGKNLHVNISSNNAAINTLAMNANDLRVQLNNNGIQNATLNFNSGSSDGSQANSQGQSQRQNQHASKEYNYFENEDNHEEVISSLEIVVPNYA